MILLVYIHKHCHYSCYTFLIPCVNFDLKPLYYHVNMLRHFVKSVQLYPYGNLKQTYLQMYFTLDGIKQPLFCKERTTFEILHRELVPLQLLGPLENQTHFFVVVDIFFFKFRLAILCCALPLRQFKERKWDRKGECRVITVNVGICTVTLEFVLEGWDEKEGVGVKGAFLCAIVIELVPRNYSLKPMSPLKLSGSTDNHAEAIETRVQIWIVGISSPCQHHFSKHCSNFISSFKLFPFLTISYLPFGYLPAAWSPLLPH